MERIDALNAIDEGIKLWWRTIGRARGFTIHTGDIEYVLSADRNGPERIYSVRLSPDNPECRIDEIVSGMKSGALPGGMILTPLSTPENIADLLRRRGFTIEDASPCMALELDGFHTAQNPGYIGVHAVEDMKAMQAWARIVCDGLFGCELFTLDQFDDMLRLAETALYVATWDGIPASACMTIRGSGVATLECVATLPEFRRRGLAAALSSRALSDLKAQGVRVATLRSEPEAVPLYRKLGFDEYCRRIIASLNIE